MRSSTRRFLLALLAVVCTTAAPAVAHAQDGTSWDQRAAAAARNVQRLAPSSFTTMPQNVRAELTRRGCRVPQGRAGTAGNNTIRGSFAAPGQTDWAALCSHNGSSTVEVVWGGTAQCVSSLRPKADKDVMMDNGTDRSKPDWAYDRSISAVQLSDAAFLRREFRSLRYQGINDGWEGGSATLICRAGRWITIEEPVD